MAHLPPPPNQKKSRIVVATVDAQTKHLGAAADVIFVVQSPQKTCPQGVANFSLAPVWKQMGHSKPSPLSLEAGAGSGGARSDTAASHGC